MPGRKSYFDIVRTPPRLMFHADAFSLVMRSIDADSLNAWDLGILRPTGVVTIHGTWRR